MDFRGKTVIVTGGSRGIGRAICTAFAAYGANVVINYAGNEAAALKTKEACVSRGSKAEIFKADVSSFEESGALIDFALATFGGLDILVNNAGKTKDGLLLRMSEDDFDHIIDTNLKGAFCCTRHAAKIFSKQRYGRIINMSSVVALSGNAGQANYCASKAGLIGLTKAVAKELASRSVTVNAIAPGFITTEMTNVLSEIAKHQMLDAIPLKRYGSPEDIANAALFLASDEASYITGQVLSVNGGMWM